MFPNLRLIIGAAIATIALIMIMGSGVLSFRDPYRSVADVPDLRRPLVQHSIVQNPELRQFRVAASARRNDELQRLLDLPAGPLLSDVPDTATVYTFKITSPIDDSSTTDTGPAAEASPTNGQPPGDQGDSARVASAPSAIEDAAATSAGAASVGAASTSTAPLAVAPSQLAAADPALTPSADTAPAEPSVKAAALDDETGAVPVSSIPAIEHAPLPRTNPREAHNRAEAGAAAARPAATRTVRARPRKNIRAVRILPRRPVQPAPSPFGTPQGQPSPSDPEIFNYRPYNIQ